MSKPCCTGPCLEARGKAFEQFSDILVDQGMDDQFLAEQLKPEARGRPSLTFTPGLLYKKRKEHRVDPVCRIARSSYVHHQ